MTIKKIKKNSGFAMLVAIIITGILLLISFVVADIAFEQIVITQMNQQSQYAFYNADSGTECAMYWDLKNGHSGSFDPATTTGTILCNGQTITTGSEVVPTIPSQPSKIGGEGSGGGGGAYSYSRPIVINHNKVGTVNNTDQSSFPVLICANGSSPCNTSVSGLNQSGVGAHVQNANGYDIVFTSDSGCSQFLNWEMENYVASTGEIEAWVRIPILSHSADTTIYMCYGNSAVSSFQGGASGLTWDSNYMGVYHMSDNAANTTVKDSTSNGFNGIDTYNTNTKSVPGIIGNSLAYNSSASDQTPLSTSGTLSGTFTSEQWVKPASIVTANTFIGARGGPSFDAKLESGTVIHADIGGSSGWIDTSADASYTTSIGTWYQIVYVVNTTGYLIYADGSLIGSGTYSASTPLLYGSGNTLTIGDCGNGCGEYFNGSIDEVRVSNIARSADWIKTEYNNESSPSTFETFGSETTGGGGGGGNNPVSIFSVNFSQGCAIVQVTKNADGTTEIDSRGYNTCSGSAVRRVERGITITY